MCQAIEYAQTLVRLASPVTQTLNAIAEVRPVECPSDSCVIGPFQIGFVQIADRDETARIGSTLLLDKLRYLVGFRAPSGFGCVI